MTTVHLRTLSKGEEDALLKILESAYGIFHNETEVRALLSSSAVHYRGKFELDGCFLAEEDRSPLGSVAVTRLPRHNGFVIRYLAVARREKKKEIAEALLTKAMDYTRSRNSDYVRATTPALESYVSTYQKFGFVPNRRDFRITWDLRGMTHEEKTALKVQEMVKKNNKEVSQMFVKSLSPYWDWRTEEQGGPNAVADSFVDGLKHGERWLICSSEEKIVGLTGMIPNYYGPGSGRFRGAYVFPDQRGKGFGLEIMKEALNLARELRQKQISVYTFSYLDHLAPGALLYLRSGGKIEAEYTQLMLT